MLRVLADGEERHRLEDARGREVGWVRGRVVTLGWFADERRALAATGAAWRALDATLRRAFAGWPRYAPALDRLHVVHDGVDEWLSDGHARLARVVRPRRGAAPADAVALAFELPSYAHEGLAVTAAQAMAQAVHEPVAPVAAHLPTASHAPHTSPAPHADRATA
ncbi:hypothetical protein [Roseisolibacter sp. H3M3-2]|uniref:hypothetical protein n=1 Tax=Roseisolibacter sp. H3M3-2 TaxID=3031323 RepID=UPI0023DBAACA|nr:hypothetical protein [Roseisolibacter sp. H3M3-2]MDF1506369.1 hypothetical protein [Roseisolibacter sp. H3M3-2]